jgi:hypothetical protein
MPSPMSSCCHLDFLFDIGTKEWFPLSGPGVERDPGSLPETQKRAYPPHSLLTFTAGGLVPPFVPEPSVAPSRASGFGQCCLFLDPSPAWWGPGTDAGVPGGGGRGHPSGAGLRGSIHVSFLSGLPSWMSCRAPPSIFPQTLVSGNTSEMPPSVEWVWSGNTVFLMSLEVLLGSGPGSVLSEGRETEDCLVSMALVWGWGKNQVYLSPQELIVTGSLVPPTSGQLLHDRQGRRPKGPRLSPLSGLASPWHLINETSPFLSTE